MEPPNKGHFGTSHTVLCRGAVLFSEVKDVLVHWEGCAEMCGGCLYLRGSFIGGSTVLLEVGCPVPDAQKRATFYKDPHNKELDQVVKWLTKLM